MPKTKPKKLVIKVMDIKSEVKSDFQINDIIAEISSDEVERKAVIFGRGENADVRFSGDNAFIADE